MGRTQNKKVNSFFKFDEKEKKSKCNVCGVKLAGSHATNLKRHLTSKHAEIYYELDSNDNIVVQKNIKKRKITYGTSEEALVSSIIKIVTTDGKSFLFLESEGFREILNPIYSALSMNPITSRNIMNYVTTREQAIKNNIRALVKGKLLSLKIDVATRMDKAILGVNLQLIHSSITKTEIVVKTLGMIQLFHSHTGMYIKEKIMEILHDYGITLDQIFSITSDNGRNMVKAIQILNDATEETILDDDTNGEYLMEKLDSIELANIHLVRCAAHTLQLCVYDINKLSEVSEKVNTCRKLCKSLRTETNRRFLIEHKKNIPSLDVVTRWNSTYLMVEKLFELKDFLAVQSDITIDVDWDWMEIYIDAFKDTYEATLKLQEKKLVYSEFFIIWMELKLKCENSQNYIKMKLLAQIKTRECKLLENDALLAAIYMDPRVNCILTDQQKLLAKQNLKKIAYRLFELKQAHAAIQNVLSPEVKIYNKQKDPLFISSEEKSLFSAYLDDVQTLTEINEEPVSEKLAKIYADVENFDLMYGRLPLNMNILQFFDNMKLQSPHLSALSLVVLATPATQVSVERAFSALHFILSEKRSSLSAQNLNSLLVVKLNPE